LTALGKHEGSCQQKRGDHAGALCGCRPAPFAGRRIHG
jgi:hypothetical protein